METEKFRGYTAAIVAALAVIGGAIGAVYVWQMSLGVNPPPETTLIFGIFTGLIGTGSTFLFMSDAGSRASHAAERSFTSGSITGSQLPDQAAMPSAATNSAPSGPPTPGPQDGADSL